MSKNFVKDSLCILYELRSELHESVEGNALQKLDEAIQLLENAEKNKQNMDKKEIISILGKVLEYIPTIVKIIDLLK